jgi:hypothetical protein
MYVRVGKNHWAKNEEKKPVDNQPAHYYKKPEHIKPGTKKKRRIQRTKNQSENHWIETNRLFKKKIIKDETPQDATHTHIYTQG